MRLIRNTLLTLLLLPGLAFGSDLSNYVEIGNWTNVSPWADNNLNNTTEIGPFAGLNLDQSDVVLLIGQSNMSGRADYDSLGGHPSGVSQWNQSGELVDATVPLDHPSQPAGTMGLDISFADDYRAAFSNSALIYVPYAVGSTGFADNNWNQGDPQYNSAVSQANAALAGIPDSQLKAILWLQGEQDAYQTNALTEAQYATALDNMIFALRSDITGAEEVPFVAGQIPVISGGLFPTNTEVNTAISKLPGRMFNTGVALNTSLTKIGDGLHYDAPSLRIMGNRLFDSLEPIINRSFGPELIAPIDFQTGWGFNNITPTGANTYTATNFGNAYKNFFTVGKKYSVTINATYTSSFLFLYNSSGAINQIDNGINGIVYSGVNYTAEFVAADTELNIRPASAGDVTVNYISAKEIIE